MADKSIMQAHLDRDECGYCGGWLPPYPTEGMTDEQYERLVEHDQSH